MPWAFDRKKKNTHTLDKLEVDFKSYLDVMYIEATGK